MSHPDSPQPWNISITQHRVSSACHSPDYGLPADFSFVLGDGTFRNRLQSRQALHVEQAQVDPDMPRPGWVLKQSVNNLWARIAGQSAAKQVIGNRDRLTSIDTTNLSATTPSGEQVLHELTDTRPDPSTKAKAASIGPSNANRVHFGSPKFSVSSPMSTSRRAARPIIDAAVPHDRAEVPNAASPSVNSRTSRDGVASPSGTGRAPRSGRAFAPPPTWTRRVRCPRATRCRPGARHRRPRSGHRRLNRPQQLGQRLVGRRSRDVVQRPHDLTHRKTCRAYGASRPGTVQRRQADDVAIVGDQREGRAPVPEHV